MPLWVALAVVGAAYIFRSVVLRGGDFSPDLPDDAVAGATILIALAFVAITRAIITREIREDDAPHERDDEDGETDEQR